MSRTDFSNIGELRDRTLYNGDSARRRGPTTEQHAGGQATSIFPARPRSPGHRILSPWNAEYPPIQTDVPVTKAAGTRGDVNLPWHNGPIRTQTACAGFVLHFKSSYACDESRRPSSRRLTSRPTPEDHLLEDALLEDPKIYRSSADGMPASERAPVFAGFDCSEIYARAFSPFVLLAPSESRIN